MSQEPSSTTANPGAAGERGQGTQEKSEKSEAQVRAEVEAEWEGKLTGFLESNEGYKGLQRAFSKREREWAEANSRKESELSTLRGQVEQLNGGLGFLNDALYEAADPDTRAKMEKELEKRKQNQLTTELAELRKAITNPPQQAQQTQWSQDDWDKAFADAEREAMDSMKETIKELGVDPANKEIDYGDPGKESFAVRLKKAVKTAKAIKTKTDDEELEEVRQKVTPPPTRTGGGAPVSSAAGESENLLRLGAAEWMEEMRRNTPKGPRRK